MKPPAPFTGEVGRLEALRRLRVLDTAAEERFDRITRLACRSFDVPMALVSFCGHAIHGNRPNAGTCSPIGTRGSSASWSRRRAASAASA